MKKVTIIILSILCLYVIYKINFVKTLPVSLTTYPVFNMNDYNIFYLDLSEDNITTLNINKTISNDIDIISVTPYVNPIYKKTLGNLKYKFIHNISRNRNIHNFVKYYKNTIKGTGYLEDLNYISIDGIKILEIEVYAKGEDIIKLLYKNNKIKYKTVSKNEYKYLEV